ncbi:MATE family efflux transporter [Panacibacter sp. DH6]|uniref:Multidrug-efflux transporter n=1 Tax=Panacibacter microcysteis TaxID=2793269 RepID=A0A931E6R3_9BACT|nr:MATE family efflux transporter [Panacibacter microcysteis]MBG9374761.1 MATE family efflux transporter [Panacibacter microcysteis]
MSNSNHTTKSIFALIKQSLKGDEQMDYTSGSIRKAVFMLAIPMIIEMSMESVFALVDLFFVGHLHNSQHTLQTVSLTESVLSIMYALAIGISMAATAVVARRIGEKNPDAAATAGVQAIWLSLILTAIISVAGFIYAADILRLMGAEPETIAMGTTYTRIMMGGSIVIMLLFLINGIFRGAGDASMAMKSLMIANCCNIVLCPLLINGLGPIPAFGLNGAAMATTIGRGIGVVYQLYHLFKGAGVIKIHRKNIKMEWPVIRSLVNIASPGTFQFIIGSCSWILLARLVAETGHSTASAGYQTAIRVVIFFILPAWGLSNASATLVGQNLGAKQPDRAQESVLKTAKYSGVFMGIVSLIFLLGAEPILGIFTNDVVVKEIAAEALRIITAGYIFYGVGMVIVSSFNGAGDTWTPTWINLFGFWLFQIPLAYLLAQYFKMGPTGVFIAIPVAETLMAVAAFILFRRGKWKTVTV